MTFLFLPLLTDYITNAEFDLMFAVMCKSDFKILVPAIDIIDFHVKKSWEFNVYSGLQMCLCKVLIHVVTLQYQVTGIVDHTFIIP